jgi:P pilus assembly chaperone PapD
MKNMLRCNINPFPAVFIVFFLLFSADVLAQGNLLINPKRVIFEGQKRSQEITLANTGNDTARYVVSFVQNRMTDEGNFEQVTQPDSGQNFADKYLRIFPRTVVLGPHEAQIVKVQVSQSNKILPGEYRSHLYFRALPKENPLGDKPGKTDTAGVSVRLTAIFGISIPVIIRSGELTASASLTNLQLDSLPENQKVLKITFNRSGNMSLYGDLSVEHISNEGKVSRVRLIKGISVYTPNKIRNLIIKLDNTGGINYLSGKLRVNYSTSPEEKSRNLASAELSLN